MSATKKSIKKPNPVRGIRFTEEELREVQLGSANLNMSVPAVVRLCIRTVRPGHLPKAILTHEEMILSHLRNVTNGDTPNGKAHA